MSAYYHDLPPELDRDIDDDNGCACCGALLTNDRVDLCSDCLSALAEDAEEARREAREEERRHGR